MVASMQRYEKHVYIFLQLNPKVPSSKNHARETLLDAARLNNVLGSHLGKIKIKSPVNPPLRRTELPTAASTSRLLSSPITLPASARGIKSAPRATKAPRARQKLTSRKETHAEVKARPQPWVIRLPGRASSPRELHQSHRRRRSFDYRPARQSRSRPRAMRPRRSSFAGHEYLCRDAEIRSAPVR